jgi:hypothetical protein
LIADVGKTQLCGYRFAVLGITFVLPAAQTLPIDQVRIYLLPLLTLTNREANLPVATPMN